MIKATFGVVRKCGILVKQYQDFKKNILFQDFSKGKGKKDLSSK